MRLPDGTVQCWGRNNFGQLGNGDGSLTSSSVPVAVRGLTTATRVVTGDAHTCALLGDGTVQCWGVGDSGQRGDGTFNNISTVPAAVVGITGAVAVAARGYHSCALLGDGTVWCWGRNSDGQLGVTPSGSQCPTTPGFFCSSTPVRAAGITSAAGVIAGGYHTCALFGDGTAQCWGRNYDGQLGDGTATSSSTPVRVGGITGAVAVSAGVLHTCALLSDWTVKCWGAVGPGNDFGQLGNGATTGSSTPVTVTGTGMAWTSSNGAVATIDAGGRATAVSAGTATITATDGSGGSASTTLTVRDLGNLSVVRAGTGSGTVSSSLLGISCGTDCSEPYASGTVVTLTAAPASGSTFDGWSGCDTASGATCTVTMGGVRMVGATFNVQRFTLTVNLAGMGSGTVSSSPLGISCGTDCSESYDSSTSVTLTAAPASGSIFGSWNGCNTVVGSTCTVTMSVARTVSATFNVQQFTLTVNRAGTGAATVSSSPLGISCGTNCSAPYDSGTSVALTASPAGGSTLGIWSGCDTASGATCAVTMSTTKSVTLVLRSADALPVTPANPTIGVGQTQQFTASGALTPTAVAAGGLHTCMRLPDGTVQCWGQNT